MADRRTNRSLLWPYLIPYVAYVAIAAIPAAWLGPTANYALRLAVTSVALGWAWRQYAAFRGPLSPAGSVAVGAMVGIAGTVLWIGLKSPFVSAAAGPWDPLGFGLRLVASGLLVPVFEELLVRGYVLRLVVQWDQARAAGVRDSLGRALDESSIDDVEPGAWTPLAVLLSTAVFTAGHAWPAEWPAAAAYGLLMAGLWVWRKDLLSCVTAHAVTNVALALYVRSTAHWELW